ncbi:ribonuclease J [Polymorphobacter sp. PAMC 29334]|uniref:ribonuclease J n=1 Tax=Polymorphobacter sp. PAMC 29334 TaxID=2862331 RepID=UPI001D00A66B|nr:ribonuclease J [Polymorphobacter sp. PAMC 29334]
MAVNKNKNFLTPGDELLFLPLGGSGEIGMNVNLYGCRGKWVMVDLGMTFADPSYPGVDLILPDLSFIEERREDLLGIVITHGHEDHIGAIPYLAADLGVPIYATPFTAGLIRGKLEEEGLTKEVKLHVIPMGGSMTLGDFKFSYAAMAHSIPEGNGLIIETPHGRIFHTGDWKLDDQPQMGSPSTPDQLRALGDSGVLAMIGDSTNVFNAKASGSEAGVRDGLLEVIRNRKTGRVLVTTFASNAARLHTLGQVALQVGRQVCVVGRSMDRILGVARATGYLKDFPPILSFDQAARLDPSKLLIICTGAQGEPAAALSRIASGSHQHLKLERGDCVIYSSKEIPGNELSIGIVQNALATRGVEVITERQAHVHVSGHPGKPELEAMYGWVRPEIAIPVHGERRHLEAHAKLALDIGVPRAMVPTNGNVIRLAPNGPKLIGNEKVGRLVLDGDVILPADGSTMLSRRRIMHNGYMSATVVLNGSGKLAAKPAIMAQGVPVEEDATEFIAECSEAAAQAVRNGDSRNPEKFLESIRVAVRRVARDWTGKKPVTDVQIVRV